MIKFVFKIFGFFKEYWNKSNWYCDSRNSLLEKHFSHYFNSAVNYNLIYFKDMWRSKAYEETT